MPAINEQSKADQEVERLKKLLRPEYLLNAGRVGSILIIALLVGLLGVVAAVGVSEYRSWAAIMLWGLASFAVATIVGFLFGVPQIEAGLAPNQVGAGKGASAISEAAPGASASNDVPADTGKPTLPVKDDLAESTYHFIANNSVQQISDWLTKIIVGLGLVELKNVPELAKRFGALISHSSQSGDVPAPAHAAIGIATGIYFGATGFLAAYLFMRLCVQVMIARVEGPLSDPRRLRRELDRWGKELEEGERADELKKREDDSRVIKVANKIEGSIAQMASSERRSRWLDLLPLAASLAGTAAGPAMLQAALSRRATRISEDPHKGRFGGKAERNGRKMSATVVPVPSDPDLFNISLTVESTDPAKPLEGPVIFYLHPTFRESTVTREVDKDGKVRLPLVGWGAFTVGATIDNGKTQLELDLAELPDVPEKFKAR